MTLDNVIDLICDPTNCEIRACVSTSLDSDLASGRHQDYRVACRVLEVSLYDWRSQRRIHLQQALSAFCGAPVISWTGAALIAGATGEPFDLDGCWCLR